jgi:hypothetical protein
LIGHRQFAMQIHDYDHASEGKLFEASPNEIDPSLKGAIGTSPDSKERLSQSSNPEASGVEPSEEFISKDASLR